ncbi:MAG: sulfotransferase [Oscillatoria sp. PMC 1068.18]|nr:sulfotransferase [Oscillatoria sp. PMC 1076.18]MEC4989694.1 sulfotransferase [Oscillatoria sp. PMC 1068.18]
MKVKYGVILGCPRSGTTFLSQALLALPNTECIWGSHLPVSVPHIINNSISEVNYQALAFGFRHSLDNYLDSAINSQAAAMQKFLKGCLGWQEMWQALQRKRKVDMLVYKEPFLAFAPEFAYTALPDCKIIHIYRDGRDCANSLVRSYQVLTDEKLQHLQTAEMPLGRKYDRRYVPWWVEVGKEREFLDSTPYVRAVWMWKEMVRSCHEFFSRPEVVKSDRVLLLKYEDLVNDPVNIGKNVVEHLGGSMSDRLRQRFQQAKTSSVGKYKKRDPLEIETATAIAREELKLYGYL